MGLGPTTTFTALDAYCHEGCPPCQSNNAALWCGGDMGVEIEVSDNGGNRGGIVGECGGRTVGDARGADWCGCE